MNLKLFFVVVVMNLMPLIDATKAKHNRLASKKLPLSFTITFQFYFLRERGWIRYHLLVDGYVCI